MAGVGALPPATPDLTTDAVNAAKASGETPASVLAYMQATEIWDDTVAKITAASRSTFTNAYRGGFDNPAAHVVFTNPPSSDVITLLKALPIDVTVHVDGIASADELGQYSDAVYSAVSSTPGVAVSHGGVDPNTGEIDVVVLPDVSDADLSSAQNAADAVIKNIGNSRLRSKVARASTKQVAQLASHTAGGKPG